jgi:hypothetical protein
MATPLTNERLIALLFERLATKYGREFIAQYAGLDMAAVKADWSNELRDYTGELGGTIMRWALEHLPERCPNSIQFHNLCRQAPRPEPKAILEAPAKSLTAEQRDALMALKSPMGRLVAARYAWAYKVAQKDVQDPKSITPTVRAMYKAVIAKHPMDKTCENHH